LSREKRDVEMEFELKRERRWIDLVAEGLYKIEELRMPLTVIENGLGNRC